MPNPGYGYDEDGLVELMEALEYIKWNVVDLGEMTRKEESKNLPDYFVAISILQRT